MATFNVTTEAQLNAAFATMSGSVTSDIVNINADFSLNTVLAPLSPSVIGHVTINGGGHTINGAGIFQGLRVLAGFVVIGNLTITNARARGGNGGDALGRYGGGGGGGGGLGYVWTKGTLAGGAMISPAPVSQ